MHLIFMLICVLFLTVPTSLRKSKKKHYPDSQHSSKQKKHVGRTGHAFQTEQFYLEGTLRKTFAMDVFLSDGAANSKTCSPLAALMPLAKLVLGASGKTEKELYDVIGSSSQSKILSHMHGIIKKLENANGIKLNMASKLFVSDSGKLNNHFINQTLRTFKSSAQLVSFDDRDRAESLINEWLKNETHGFLSNPFELKVSSAQKMIILNIVTFMGVWEKKFSWIQAEEFKSPKGSISVPMMSCESTYNYHRSDSLQAELLEVPFEGRKASFIIVLPQNNAGLNILLRQLKLAPELINKAIENMRPTAVALSMPKFKLRDKLDLKPVYKMVGLNKIFDRKTGLTGIVDGEEVPISSAWQITYIDVGNEINPERSGNDTDPVQRLTTFNANRPFLFYVVCGKEQLLTGIFSGYS